MKHNMIRTALMWAVLLGFSVNGFAQLTDWPEKCCIPSERMDVAGMDVPYYIGGYGSDLVFHAADSTFWLLTDRGPNVEGRQKNTKIFPAPDFQPRVGVFRWDGEQMRPVRTILLKNSDGRAFTGLPNVDGDGKTGEKAYGLDGPQIKCQQSSGIDPEGLAVMPDGSFWISDEYGPFLMKFSQDGICVKVCSPFDGTMPRHYADRKPNRGLEGLCTDSDGKVLYGIMQSPLMTEKRRVLPLWEYCIENEEWHEFLYPLEQGSEGVSALCWQADRVLLVLERDGRFPGKGETIKRIYRVNLPEQQGDGLIDLKKELVMDLAKTSVLYNHDKAEGLALIGDSIICVANDDDFGINAPQVPDNSVIEKKNPQGERDVNEIRFIRYKMDR